jgi:hypothetical protein
LPAVSPPLLVSRFLCFPLSAHLILISLVPTLSDIGPDRFANLLLFSQLTLARCGRTGEDTEQRKESLELNDLENNSEPSDQILVDTFRAQYVRLRDSYAGVRKKVEKALAQRLYAEALNLRPRCPFPTVSEVYLSLQAAWGGRRAPLVPGGATRFHREGRSERGA